MDGARLAAADLLHPEKRELLGPGRTLHLHATDTAPEAAAEWLIDLTGDAIVWRRVHEKAAVAVRGPLTNLLLVVYRRLPAQSEGIEAALQALDAGEPLLLYGWMQ